MREGVWELRIDAGPGYRVYYAIAEKHCVLLLCGGDYTGHGNDVDGRHGGASVKSRRVGLGLIKCV